MRPAACQAVAKTRSTSSVSFSFCEVFPMMELRVLPPQGLAHACLACAGSSSAVRSWDTAISRVTPSRVCRAAKRPSKRSISNRTPSIVVSSTSRGGGPSCGRRRMRLQDSCSILPTRMALEACQRAPKRARPHGGSRAAGAWCSLRSGEPREGRHPRNALPDLAGDDVLTPLDPFGDSAESDRLAGPDRGVAALAVADHAGERATSATQRLLPAQVIVSSRVDSLARARSTAPAPAGLGSTPP